MFDQGTLLSTIGCILSKGMTQPERNKLGNVAYIPVAHLDDTTVGYVFAFEVSVENSPCAKNKNQHDPFEVPFVARFAYDHRGEGNLLFVTSGGKPREIGISSDFFKTFDASESTFFVPSKEYTWGDLPRDPSIVFQGTEDMRKFIYSHNMQDLENVENYSENIDSQDSCQLQDSTSILDASTIISETSLRAVQQVHDSNYQHDDFFNSSTLLSSANDIDSQADVFKSNKRQTDSSTDIVMSRMNYTPWMISSDGQISDGVSYSGSTGNAETSSSMFNTNRTKEYMGEVEKAMTKRPFAVPKRLDIQDPYPEHPPGFYCEFECAETFIQGTLRQSCMQVYYDVVLTINVDYNFFTRNPSKELKLIAPRPQNEPIATPKKYHYMQKGKDRCACGSLDCQCAIAHRAKKAETLEQRKRRNRMSAARSNEKRKARNQATKQKLSESKQYIDKLKEKEKQIITKNNELRKQLLGVNT